MREKKIDRLKCHPDMIKNSMKAQKKDCSNRNDDHDGFTMGISLGIVFGLLFDNIGMGIALGVGIGIAWDE